MGMFDYFMSSFQLGEQFTNKLCQTRDFEEDIGGTMDFYWLDPAGQLWYIDVSSTQRVEVLEPGHPNYSPSAPWANFEWHPTGINGKVKPLRITKPISIVPSSADWSAHNIYKLRLHFVEGVLTYPEDLGSYCD